MRLPVVCLWSPRLRRWTEKVARNAINRIVGLTSRPYSRELNAATIDALSARNIEVDVKSSRRLDKPLRASGGKGLGCVSPNTTVSPTIAPVPLFGNFKRGLRRLNLNGESLGELRISPRHDRRNGQQTQVCLRYGRSFRGLLISASLFTRSCQVMSLPNRHNCIFW